MFIKKLTQGSPEWHEHRDTSWNASELPSVMDANGAYVSRAELLRQKTTGIGQEISPQLQARFDAGHAAEAAARLLLEEELGIEFYPVTGVSDTEPRLSASYDGLDMMEGVGFEHKLWNQELASAINSGTIPAKYMHQLHQQFAVCKTLGVIYFVCSDGTKENRVVMPIYRPSEKEMEYIVPAWELFEKDKEGFRPVEVEVLTSTASFDSLPYLSIQVQGGVIASNLTEFREKALEIIKSVNTDLRDDQDFANAEQAVKWCEGVEAKLEAQKTAILSQTADIAMVLDTLTMLKEETRQVRLGLSNAVKDKKKSRKDEIVREAKAAFAAVIQEQEKKLGTLKLMPVPPDFDAATKNKRTIATLIDSVEGELAKAKLAAIMKADRMAANIALVTADIAFMFRDLQMVADKEHDDFQRLVNERIESYKAELARREQEKAEAEAKRLAEEASPPVEPATSAPVEPERVAAQAIPPSYQESRQKEKKPYTAEIVSAAMRDAARNESICKSIASAVNNQDAGLLLNIIEGLI